MSDKQPLPSGSPARSSRQVAPAREADRPGSAERTPSIREEIDLLDRARAALARREFELALTLLDRYSTRYPHGELSEEAKAVRLDALRRRPASTPPSR